MFNLNNRNKVISLFLVQPYVVQKLTREPRIFILNFILAKFNPFISRHIYCVPCIITCVAICSLFIFVIEVYY